MTDNDDRSDDEGETFEEFYRSQRDAALHALPDALLTAFTSVVNSHEGGFSFSLTVFVGGTIISGELTAGNVWMEGFAGEIDTEVGSDVGQTLSSPLRSVGQNYRLQNLDERIWGDEEEARAMFFIHLSNATIFQGGQRLVTGIRWRGRLAEIDGWSIGRINQD